MGTYRNDITGDVVTADGPTADFLAQQGHWTPQDDDGGVEEFDPFELKGEALDDALGAWGLSKSGTADEKRQRLADHLTAPDADSNDDDPDPSQDQ